MKSRKAMYASVLVLAGLALAGSACGPAGEELAGALATERSRLIAATEDPEGTKVWIGDLRVMYEVTGDANGVTITMLNESGGIDQGNYMLPYRYVARFPLDTPSLSISALIIDPTQGSPEATCRISITTWEVSPEGVFTPVNLEAKAEASGPGNVAKCLWENADN